MELRNSQNLAILGLNDLVRVFFMKWNLFWSFFFFLVLILLKKAQMFYQKWINENLTNSTKTVWLMISVYDYYTHYYLKGALDKFNIILQLFPKKVGIFIPLEVLAWVMTTFWVLCSRLTYFWRYMNISSIFYFSKSTSINTQCSSLWNTLKMKLFTKYLIKWKHIGRISWNFWY